MTTGIMVEFDQSATAVADDETDLDQRIATAASLHREQWWLLADLAAKAVAQRRTPREQRRRVNEIASLAHCTSSYIRALIAVASHYGTETRYPDVSLALFRACIAAATRTHQRAQDVLDDALAKGWHVREVQALGRAETVTYRLTATCEGCGARSSITMTGCGGLPVPCGVCLALARADGRELTEAYVVIGSLGLSSRTQRGGARPGRSRQGAAGQGMAAHGKARAVLSPKRRG